jgi:hypothetical protein
MALIQAIASSPRIARTKFGDKTVLDCRLESGEPITIWKEANNPQLMSITNGERLVLSPIEKHQGGYTYEIRETSRSKNDAQRAARETAPDRPMGFNVTPIEPEQIKSVQKPVTLPAVGSIEPAALPAETKRSIEIADYIGKLGKLYSHCYKTASEQLESTPLATPEVKDVATTLFIQTVKHFNL